MNFATLRRAALVSSLTLFGAQTADAAVLSGTFAQDNDIQFFTFTLASDTNVSIGSTSFATGGFVPWLTIWDSTGQFYMGGSNGDSGDTHITNAGFQAGTYYGAVYVWHNFDPGAAGFSGAGPGTNFADVYDPAQFWHNGAFDVNPNYTVTESLCIGTPGNFVFDIGGCASRSGDWALNIVADAGLSGVSPYPAGGGNGGNGNGNGGNVPEPGTLALLAGGLGGFASARRRRAR